MLMQSRNREINHDPDKYTICIILYLDLWPLLNLDVPVVSSEPIKRSSVEPDSCSWFVLRNVTVSHCLFCFIGEDLLRLVCFVQFLSGILVLAVGVTGACGTVRENKGWMALVSGLCFVLGFTNSNSS